MTEFVVKPVNARTLLDRIMAVIYRPRPFVRTKTYFGPDRRRRAAPNFAGPYRRVDDSQDRPSGTGALDDDVLANGVSRDFLI